MDIYDIRKIRTQAIMQIETADRGTREIAHLCKDRLRLACVPHHILCSLKRELQNYNMHTSDWKD